MKQLEFSKTRGWGGKRRGAGRRNRSETVNHMRRERVDFSKPLHITQRLKPGMPALRQRKVLKVFRRAIVRAKVFDLNVLHYSLLGNHLHMIVEARDNEALGSGFRSLFGSLAKQLQRLKGLTGSIFLGRYHLRKIATPTQMKRTLTYVLLNQAQHSDLAPHLDEYSSAFYFGDWPALVGKRMNVFLESATGDPLSIGLSTPRSWLARTGWRRARTA